MIALRFKSLALTALLAALVLASSGLARAETISFTVGSSSGSGLGDSYSTDVNNSGSVTLNPGDMDIVATIQTGTFNGGSSPPLGSTSFSESETFSVDGVAEADLNLSVSFTNTSEAMGAYILSVIDIGGSGGSYLLNDGYTLTLDGFGAGTGVVGFSSGITLLGEFSLSATPAAVPEPSSLILAGIGSLAGLGFAGWKKSRRAAVAR